MNNYVLAKCHIKDESYILKRVLNYNINIIYSFQKGEYLFYKFERKDFELICELDYKKALIFVKDYGLNYLKYFLKNNIENIIMSIAIIVIVFLSRLIILNVNIYINDKNLEKQIRYTLEDENIKNYSLKKSFDYIKKVKSKILKTYKDDIEWIEIKNNGYNYDVYIIKRKKQDKKSKNIRCHYVAIKSGTVRSIIAKRGVIQTQENNFVNSGDILISGQVIYNEELKNEVCASGKVYGEVWYKVNVSYPLIKEVNYKNSDGKINVKFNIFNKGYKLFNDKLNNEKSLFRIGFDGLNINFIKSESYAKKKVKISEKNAQKKALTKARKNVLIKANKNAKIIDENILKKYIKNDKIYLEVLISVEEEIGVVENF